MGHSMPILDKDLQNFAFALFPKSLQQNLHKLPKSTFYKKNAHIP